MKTKKIWWSISGLYKPAVFLMLLGLLFLKPGCAQTASTSFPGLEQADIQEAFDFIEQESWMADSLKAHGLDPAFALAIVFPEIIRYSAIRDWAETKALEVLYVQYGSPYADFSIGRFQIKPTFAELLDGNSASTGSPESIRLQRLRRLQDLKGQLQYLIMFCKHLDFLFPEYRIATTEEKLRFYATAYNTGFHKSKQQILRHLGQSEFYTTLRKPEKCMNYADVADWGYQMLKGKGKR